MALLFLEGFEQWNSYDNNEVQNQYNPVMSAYWESKHSSDCITATSPVRTSQSPAGRSLNGGLLATGAYLKIPTVTETYIGFAVYITSVIATNSFFHILQSSATRTTKGIQFRFNSNYKIEVIDTSTSAVLGVTSSALPLNAWTYIEIKYIFGASGTLEILLDTVSALNLTSTDVRGGCTSMSVLGFWFNLSGTNKLYIDDLYVCDSTGSTNNTFLGPINVYTFFPNADATVQMTPSAGSDNYAMVDEIPVDRDTTFVQGAAGKTDLYELTDLPAITPTSIPGIMVGAISCKTNNTALTGNLVIDSGGTTESSPPISQATNVYRIMHHIWETAPGGASWTKALIDALKAGIKGS